MRPPPRAKISRPATGKPKVRIAKPSTYTGNTRTGVQRKKNADYLGGRKGEDWKAVKEKVRTLAGNCCADCGITEAQLIRKGQRFETDHIKQVSRGGTDRVTNLKLRCPDCHAKRFLHSHLRKEINRRKVKRQNSR